MRKLYFIPFMVILLCCQQKGSKSVRTINTFTGLGYLKIGNPLDSINLKIFEKKDKDEYFCDKMELTKDVGIVENVDVKLQNGKIYEVSFDEGKYTNETAIETPLFEMIKTADNPELELQMTNYKGDNGIGVTKTTFETEDISDYPTSYSYFDDSIYSKLAKEQYDKQYDAEKAEYMKDVKQ